MKRKDLTPDGDILKKVTVRLLANDERELFDELIISKHYLSSARVGGRSLRYVAELDGKWVALAIFSGASFSLKPRDQAIGWSARQRIRRLNFVVNNSRYLVLTERQKLPNLASRAMALMLRRLSRDWKTKWGHDVFLVESFVDESRHHGTSYRACGFKAVGLTTGYKRSARDFYEKHGEPKQLYLRELRPDAFKLLQQGRWPEELKKHEENIAGPCPWRAPDLESLLDLLATLKDSRKGHGLQHRQRFVLGCTAVAVLMGASSYRAIADVCSQFTQRQLKALGATPRDDGKYRSPSYATFYRVLTKVDVGMLDEIIGRWLLTQEPAALERIALDGKTLRGSGGSGDGKPLQLLSAVTHRLGLTLGQVAIKKKSNEIPAFPKLLKRIPLAEGTVITADAMNCQQESARVITQELGCEYVVGLKGNQGGIFKQAKHLLDKQVFPPRQGPNMGETSRKA